MNRRAFLSGLAGLCTELTANTAPVPIIDTHIHLFDPTRPQGVPWPEKNNPVLYKPALPDRYRKIAEPKGVVGAIEIECSPWLEDNQWVLDVAQKDPMILGTVGDLEPEKPNFRKQLGRFHRNPLFLGIRCGDLWGRDFHAAVSTPAFIGGAKLLAEAGLTMDVANPTPGLISDVVRLTDQVPNLRVVIDHLPQLDPPQERAARSRYESTLRELGGRPQVFGKVSEVLRRVNGRVPLDLQRYRETLDHLWEVFGENRLIYGSDWPNSDLWAPYDAELHLVREYFSSKGRAAMKKYFWRNSVAAYRWVKRDGSQPRSGESNNISAHIIQRLKRNRTFADAIS